MVVPHPLQYLVFLCIFILASLMDMVVLILISLMTCEDEYLLMYLYMEGYFVFTDWNTQYYKGVGVLQIHV